MPKLTSKQPGTLPGRAEQQPDVARSTLDQAEQFSDAQKSQPSQTEAHQRIHPCPPPKIDPPTPLPTPQQETGVKGDTSDLTKPRGAKTAQKNHPLTQEVDDTSSGKVCPHPATNTEYCVDVQTSGQVCTHPPVCTEDDYPTNPKKPQVDGCPSVKVHTCPLPLLADHQVATAACMKDCVDAEKSDQVHTHPPRCSNPGHHPPPPNKENSKENISHQIRHNQDENDAVSPRQKPTSPKEQKTITLLTPLQMTPPELSRSPLKIKKENSRIFTQYIEETLAQNSTQRLCSPENQKNPLPPSRKISTLNAPLMKTPLENPTVVANASKSTPQKFGDITPTSRNPLPPQKETTQRRKFSTLGHPKTPLRRKLQQAPIPSPKRKRSPGP